MCGWKCSQLTACNGSDDEEGLGAGRDGIGQWGVRRLMRKILRAGEEADVWAALLCDVITDGSAQHRIAGLERVDDGTRCGATAYIKRYLAADLSQGSQMLREYDPDHCSVCTSTESTAGRSRAIGAQVFPASGEA